MDFRTSNRMSFLLGQLPLLLKRQPYRERVPAGYREFSTKLVNTYTETDPRLADRGVLKILLEIGRE